MKVGDLIYCPVNLTTGEMLGDDWELAVITSISKTEPKIRVTYVKECDEGIAMGSWFTEEVKLINES